MVELIAASLYLFLPAYVANMAPVVAVRLRVLPALARPLDGGRRFRGQPLFGPHKTLRGIVVGLGAAVLTALVQQLVEVRGAAGFSALPPHTVSPLLWGGLLGGGALLGDLVKSFIKRRIGLAPGARWIPWDQLDIAIGALLLGRLVYPFPWATVAIILLSTPLLVLAVNVGSARLSIRPSW